MRIKVVGYILKANIEYNFSGYDIIVLQLKIRIQMASDFIFLLINPEGDRKDLRLLYS